LAQGGSPSWHIYVWLLDKAKFITDVKTTSNQNLEITKMTVCPFFESQQTHICVSGNSLFRVYKFNEPIVKLSHQTKIEKVVSSHSWINENRIAAATVDCKILLIENGDIIFEMSYVLPHAGMGLRSPEIKCIGTLHEGLIIGLDTGVAVLFQKTDDSLMYKKVNELLVDEAAIKCIGLNIHRDCMLLSLENNEIFNVSFESGNSVFVSKLV
jgi:hypothetical protein